MVIKVNHINVIRDCIEHGTKLIVQYPPDYDGQLYVYYEKVRNLRNPSIVFALEHACKEDSDPAEILVKAAEAILKNFKKDS